MRITSESWSHDGVIVARCNTTQERSAICESVLNLDVVYSQARETRQRAKDATSVATSVALIVM